MQLEIVDGNFVVDAALLGELLSIPAADVPALMRSHAITSVCEHGIDAHHDTFRLTFFYGGRQARLRIDASGQILQRSVIDFGERPPARNRRHSAKSAKRAVPEE
jgi:Family of unknown function (DUF6522)